MFGGESETIEDETQVKQKILFYMKLVKDIIIPIETKGGAGVTGKEGMTHRRAVTLCH